VGRTWKAAGIAEMVVPVGDVKVSVVYLAGCAREAGAVEVRHEIDVMTGQVSVVSEMALVEGKLEGAVMRVT
jgi:hypothetical protein